VSTWLYAGSFTVPTVANSMVFWISTNAVPARSASCA
jgi:hypothetical protein